MEPPNIQALLTMVDDLDVKLDLYLRGVAEAFEAMPEILDTCRRMRSEGVNSSMRYWIECIEFHASRISAQRKPADASEYVDAELLTMQLQHDLTFLRTHLTNMRSLVC